MNLLFRFQIVQIWFCGHASVSFFLFVFFHKIKLMIGWWLAIMYDYHKEKELQPFLFFLLKNYLWSSYTSLE